MNELTSTMHSSWCFALVLLTLLTTGAAAPGAGVLPELQELDALTSATQQCQDDATIVLDPATPITSHGAMPKDGSILFESAEFCWALYRVDPECQLLLSASAAGSGPLWLFVADFDAQGWRFAQGFEAGRAQLDIASMRQALSPDGYLYLAVICAAKKPAGLSGKLERLEVSVAE